MEIAAATVCSVLPKLQAYLHLKHDGDHHNHDAAELLSRELTSIHAALHAAAAAAAAATARGHASASQSHDNDEHEAGRAWAGAARELAYDVDDAIDAALLVTSSLSPKSARGHNGGGGDDLPRSPPISLKELLQRATDPSGSRHRVVAGEVPVPVPPPATVTHSDLLDDDEVVLVGADGARDGLIRRLRLRGDGGEVDASGDRKAAKAVAVVGSTGLGKTALARSAYGVLRPQFDCAAFVSVGIHPHIESVLQSLLRQLGFAGDSDAAATEEEPRDERKLINQLLGVLQDKRYLIVVDDLWDTLSWKKIRCALVDNHNGSRIIATTRNFDVADQVGTPYELKPLSAEDSRTLFFRTVFGHEDNKRSPDDDEFTKVAEEISKKCNGVPLAIVTLAKMLATKMGDKRDWPPKVLRGYICSGLENTPDVKNMRMVTSLGHYNLPPHLRACLLYMSVFPEDYEIRRGRLVWRWIAEGLVQFGEKNSEQESLFELGESYVDELANRSMIQLLDVDYADDGGRDECCCSVNFPVMDLISHLSSQETFTTVLDDDEQPAAACPSPQQIRRASLRGRRSKTEDDSASHLASIVSIPQRLRSLSVFSPGNAGSIDLSTAAFLRVLDLEGCDLSGSHHLLQNHIRSLIHLRYLGLRDTRIASVPEDIGELRALQTLDLADNTKVDELPASVAQLRELMCLRVYYRTRVPAGIAGLTALEELADVSTREAPDLVEELGRLTKLRVLRVTLWKPSRKEEAALVQSLRALQNLQVLDVYVAGGGGGGDCSQSFDMVREAWAPPRGLREFQARAMNSYASALRVLPAWIDAPATPRLAVLVVQLQELRQRDVEALGRLPALRVLRVDPYANKEPPVVPGGAFPRLTECRFRGSDLGPEFRRGAAPRLRRLEFSFQVRNTIDVGNHGFDFGLENLESLEEAVVYVGCQESTEPEAEAAEAALRDAAQAQPNRASFDVITFGEELMRFDDDDN